MDIGALSVRGNHDHEVVRQASKYREKVKAMGGYDPFGSTSTTDYQSNLGQANAGQANAGQTNLGQANLGQTNLGQGSGKARLQQHLELALKFTPGTFIHLVNNNHRRHHHHHRCW